MKVILTVPHSKCIIGTEHLCDYMAPKAAEIISSKIKASEIFLADKNRREFDYNRRNTRETEWRKNIKKYVLQNSVDLVLDIHSFPDDSLSFGTIQGKIPEIVILDSISFSLGQKKDDLNQKLSVYLQKNGVIVSLLSGGDNDITIEMRENGISSILIEFNEGIHRQRLEYICEKISIFFQYEILQ